MLSRKLFFVFKLGQSRKLFFVSKLGQSRELFLVFKLGQPRNLFLFSKFCVFSKLFQISKPTALPVWTMGPTRMAFLQPCVTLPFHGAASAASKNLSRLSGGAGRTPATTRQRPPPTGVRGLRGAVPAGAVDMRCVKDKIDKVKANVTARAVAVDVNTAISLYDAYLALVTATDDARRQRNLVASRMKIKAAKIGRWVLFERCSRLGEAGQSQDNQESTFALTHTSSSHSITSRWSPNPYLHCISTRQPSICAPEGGKEASAS